MTKKRRNGTVRKLDRWGKKVKNLRAKNSTGPITARAVVLMDKLDKEIQQVSKGKHRLDDVVRELMLKRKVSLEDLEQTVEALIGVKSEVLKFYFH